MRKMMYNNPKVDLVNINAYIKFDEILSICSQDIELKSRTNPRRMLCNNPKLDLVNMNAYIKFGEFLSIGPQNIERKQNFGVNQRP